MPHLKSSGSPVRAAPSALVRSTFDQSVAGQDRHGSEAWRQSLRRALADGLPHATPGSLLPWRHSGLQGHFDYGLALLESGNAPEAEEEFQEVARRGAEVFGAYPEWSVWAGRALAHTALLRLDLREASRRMESVRALLPAGGAAHIQLSARSWGASPEFRRGTLQPAPLLGVWCTSALISLLEEDWTGAGVWLKAGFGSPALKRSPAMTAAVHAVALLLYSLGPDVMVGARARHRAALQDVKSVLPPRHARLPRVAMTLDAALRGVPGAGLGLAGLHAELADAALHGQDAAGALGLVVEECALLLGVPTEPRTLYGQAVRLCRSGRESGPALARRSALKFPERLSVLGAGRRAALYGLLPGGETQDEAGRNGRDLEFRAEVDRQLGAPLAVLDRLNLSSLAGTVTLSRGIRNLLALTPLNAQRPVPLSVTLLGTRALYEEHVRLLPDLSGAQLALLARLPGSEAAMSAPAGQQDALMRLCVPPGGEHRARSQALRASLTEAAAPYGLLGSGEPLRLHRLATLECDVLVLAGMLSEGDLWGALHLLSAPLLLTGVPWVDALRVEVLVSLYAAINDVEVFTLPGAERARLHQAVQWALNELPRSGTPPALDEQQQERLLALEADLISEDAGEWS